MIICKLFASQCSLVSACKSTQRNWPTSGLPGTVPTESAKSVKFFPCFKAPWRLRQEEWCAHNLWTSFERLVHVAGSSPPPKKTAEIRRQKSRNILRWVRVMIECEIQLTLVNIFFWQLRQWKGGRAKVLKTYKPWSDGFKTGKETFSLWTQRMGNDLQVGLFGGDSWFTYNWMWKWKCSLLGKKRQRDVTLGKCHLWGGWIFCETKNVDPLQFYFWQCPCKTASQENNENGFFPDQTGF